MTESIDTKVRNICKINKYTLLLQTEMKRTKLYKYNTETDSFERFYPSIIDRIKRLSILLVISIILGAGVFLIIDYNTEKPPVEELLEQNRKLKEQYKSLDKRLLSTMNMMEEIQRRDSNFYRVLAQMDPHGLESINSKIIPTGTQTSLNKINDSRLASGLMSRMDSLDRDILLQTLSFDQIRAVAIKNKEKIRCLPASLPINVKDYTFSSGYGYRFDPIYEVKKFHPGIDIIADTGTKVYATADGIVEFSGDKSEYGNCVDIDHGNNYFTRFGHLSKILVKKGQYIKRGELIGLVGSTGKSTGSHLHYEVRLKGEPQNPVDYFFLDITPEQYDEMIRLAATAAHVMD